jgi:molybdopterin synthase catalytic subunit
MSQPAGHQDEARFAPEVMLAEIRESPLSVDEVISAVLHARAGAVASFIGIVRELDQGQGVTALDYTSHPSAAEVLRELAERVAARGDVIRLAVVHRTGHLEIGNVAVVVAVSAMHRHTAFDACRELIDTVKTSLPIWKHQIFDDGSDVWVGTT